MVCKYSGGDTEEIAIEVIKEANIPPEYAEKLKEEIMRALKEYGDTTFANAMIDS